MTTHETVRVEFPLGEIPTLRPLLLMGMIPTPEIDAKGITGKERWNAQGCEYMALTAHFAGCRQQQRGGLG